MFAEHAECGETRPRAARRPVHVEVREACASRSICSVPRTTEHAREHISLSVHGGLGTDPRESGSRLTPAPLPGRRMEPTRCGQRARAGGPDRGQQCAGHPNPAALNGPHPAGMSTQSQEDKSHTGHLAALI